MNCKIMTASEASRLLDEGKITPMDLVEQAIQATKENQPQVNAYITFVPELAMKEAEQVYRPRNQCRRCASRGRHAYGRHYAGCAAYCHSR